MRFRVLSLVYQKVAMVCIMIVLALVILPGAPLEVRAEQPVEELQPVPVVSEPYVINTPTGPVVQARNVLRVQNKSAVKQRPLKTSMPAPTDLNAILKTWRTRTNSGRTVSYNWNERFVKTSWGNLGLGAMDAFKQTPPAAPTKGEHKLRLQISKSSIWRERSGADLHSMTGRVLQTTIRDYYGPKVHVLTQICPEATKHIPELIPTTVAVFNTPFSGQTDYHISPLILHHRPLDAKWSPIASESLTLTHEQDARPFMKSSRCAKAT